MLLMSLKKDFRDKGSCEKKEKAMKVIALTNRCVASGNCVLACSQVFSQRESDGVVEVLQQRPSLNLLEKVQEAVDGCPSQVFIMEEEDNLSELVLITNDEEM